jgi:hypothetical protein
MGCVDLCESFLHWSSEQLSCVAQVLRLAGHAPGATPECGLVQDSEDCVDCADAMGLSDSICIGAAFICLP